MLAACCFSSELLFHGSDGVLIAHGFMSLRLPELFWSLLQKNKMMGISCLDKSAENCFSNSFDSSKLGICDREVPLKYMQVDSSDWVGKYWCGVLLEESILRKTGCLQEHCCALGNLKNRNSVACWVGSFCKVYTRSIRGRFKNLKNTW